MKLSDAVAEHLFTGDFLRRDERGAYVPYDRIAIDIDTGLVLFFSGNTTVGELQIGGPMKLGQGNTLTLIGLEGRQRVTYGE